ncbi:lipid droplet-regulating VLDL assembly factor AUP1 isoform X2 [Petromyzon marinus]|uniref:Lipid droplet-regulating VLDL assembly factor AUP1 n=1 Tax=Petromyzon marinus TaxID=7757 RepID=A0AAJ7SW66_PETMA|nr:ancient ubiquitous protein 1 isoform X2 [Petromyzon marinus]
MQSINIEKLFVYDRLPGDSLSLLLFLLYLPFGLCLLLLRTFIGVHVFLIASALPDSLVRRFIVRVMCSVLGLFVSQDDPRKRDKTARPLLDSPATVLTWARGYTDLGRSHRPTLLSSCRKLCSQEGSPPLLLFPEEATTSGQAGLLKFSTWPFSINPSVQPVALSVGRPAVAVNVIGSSWLQDLVWTFFLPFTHYQVRWLPTESQHEGETEDGFAKRVQELMAVELGVVSTPYSKADKTEHAKRLARVLRQTGPVAAGRASGAPVGRTAARQQDTRSDPTFQTMAQRVKEVLPHVPLAVIASDIAVTKCVDTTITNLLEGTVKFTPEDPPAVPSASPPAPTPSPSGAYSSKSSQLSSPVTSASLFGKSTGQRHLSLQERKAALYEYARRKYLEKKDLQDS